MTIYRQITVLEAEAVLDLLSDLLDGYEGLDDEIQEAIELMEAIIEKRTFTEEQYRDFAKKFVAMFDDDMHPTKEAVSYSIEYFGQDLKALEASRPYVREEIKRFEEERAWELHNADEEESDTEGEAEQVHEDACEANNVD